MHLKTTSLKFPLFSVESSKILPVLALNEIYIGESLSSRVSYLELQVDYTGFPKKDARFLELNIYLYIYTH